MYIYFCLYLFSEEASISTLSEKLSISTLSDRDLRLGGGGGGEGGGGGMSLSRNCCASMFSLQHLDIWTVRTSGGDARESSESFLDVYQNGLCR